jgi:non-specific serine/threonine protein kinase/serine/threonine-protein kinase
MTPERWQQIKEVVAGALEHGDTGGRSSFVAKVCASDTALRREVESLLASSSERLERCADELHLSRSAAPIGQRIGAYVIVREIGRGGMGAVYLAARADQEFKKDVAIKLLKRGTDTDEVLRRFRAEREILARLEHPNIARLFDGGTTAAGLPYFVMEYIAGIPVTDFCQTRNLSVEDRLRLFLKICAAVRFAHQNLVVHRDLKPVNILITNDGEPKLLDFGIAKLLGPVEHAFEVTMLDQQRLTPAYASPEQVRGDPITTVSDIYALGTLLYEMLSGKTAHRFAATRPTPTELLRVVVNEEPLRPSAVVTDPVVRRRLLGDLDNIVLKTLRKEPSRRYGGVGGLMEDIRRYLEDRPIQARSDTLAYRTGKFLKRNKIAVGAAAIVTVTLLAGTIATFMSARQAQVERAKAERRFNEVRRMANSLMFELHTSIKDLPGALPARQLVTRKALEYLDSLSAESDNDPSLRRELATAYGKLGLVTFDVSQAIDSHRKAVALTEQLVKAEPRNDQYQRDLSQDYSNLSDVLKVAGHSTDAIAFARKALTLTETLARENPADAKVQRDLADQHVAVSEALADAGDFEEALASARAAVALQEKVVTHFPSDEDAVRDLAGMYGTVSRILEELGRHREGLAYGEKSMELTRPIFDRDPGGARNRRDLWGNYFRTGRSLVALGDYDGAKENYAWATTLIEELSAADPADKGHRHWLAATYAAAAELLATTQQAAALELYNKAIGVSEKLLAEDQDRMEERRSLAEMYAARARVCLVLGQTASSGADLEKAKALTEQLISVDPENVRLQKLKTAIESARATFSQKAGK